MGASTAFAQQLLQLIFNGTPIANLADNAASSPLTQLFLSLHTADPTAGGTQASSEANYSGYARQALVRAAGGWVVTSNSVSPNSQVNFPDPTSGSPSQTLTFMGVGIAASGSTLLLCSGAIAPAIPVSFGLAGPAIAVGTTIVIV